MTPTLRVMAPALRQLPRDDTRARRERSPWRAWYGTARWQRLRWSVLVRDRFTCAMCGRIESDTSQLVGDHIEAHRGRADLFWDATNVQCLCKPCHDSDKARIESRERRGEGGV
jgi:5-methylcytosine-specific restriction endonuclease McrA